MNRSEMLQEMKAMRTSSQELTRKLEQLIQKMEQEGLEDNRQETQDISQLLEDIYPLTKTPSFFRGRRPVGVIFPDGTRIRTTSWKGVVEAVLKDCNQTPGMHDSLMELRNRVYGNSRIILGDSSEEMKSPITICPEIYFEAHYDVESLLRITLTRILSVIGYDFSGIKVVVRKV
nr:hypothetical protein [uncultured Oscillibacter sp.]